MPSPISAKEVLERLQGTGFDVPVLPEEDPRCQRLRLEPGQGVDLRDRFPGALIGGGIGDAMAGRTQARGRVLFPPATLCSESARLKSNEPLGVSEAAASKCREVSGQTGHRSPS